MRPAAGAGAALLAVAAVCLTAWSPVTAAPAGRTVGAVLPPNVTAGIAVFDRQTGTFTEQLNPAMQFRSASVVKLLIALDFLWNRGPGYGIPAADRGRLDAMLASSDDAAASHYWSQNGQAAIVGRMVSRLGLTETAGPPPGYPGYWGYTALSAADTVRIYRYLLDAAPAPVRDYIMGNLRRSTRCGTDGFDQHFGIAGAFARPWAVKQGWSGFSSGGCTAATAAAGTRRAGPGGAVGALGLARAVDLTREALHTTGTVGAGDRSIVAVFTLHPDGTPYGKAYTDLGRLVRSLNVPGAARPAGTWFGTWGSGVRVRAGATTDSAPLTTLPAGVEVLVGCQRRGQTVSAPPYVNDWWAHLPQYGGYVTNIYISSPGNQLPGVPTCR